MKELEYDNTAALQRAMDVAFSVPTLTRQLRDLAEARHRLEVLRTSERQLQTIATDNLEYIVWQKAAAERRLQEAAVDDKERQLRRDAVRAAYDTDNFEPPQGITLKHFTEVVYDPKVADTWARVNVPALMVLDTKTFEKAARAGTLPGAPVQLVEDVRATIASDLSAHLESTL